MSEDEIKIASDDVLLERYSYLAEFIHANSWEYNVDKHEEELTLISDEMDKRDG